MKKQLPHFAPPDKVIACDAIAASIDPETQTLGVTFLDEDGRQVLLSMSGPFIAGPAPGDSEPV